MGFVFDPGTRELQDTDGTAERQPQWVKTSIGCEEEGVRRGGTAAKPGQCQVR
ncbi:MAG: hypothetical protein HUU55_08050 [Myxococcales bacterium]|nr:hypothetical protein [Myxococcales bacterium]